MDKPAVFELAGIGIGPFNLGLAALCHSMRLKAVFFEQAPEFNWHPGMLIKDARLQVPFFADLVTPVDPCNKYSYMSYLHATKRLFRFAIRENYFIKRTDYNAYCKWVIAQLPQLHFGHHCEQLLYDEKNKCYTIQTNAGIFYAKRIVLGIGTVPHTPAFTENIKGAFIIHSGEYLNNKEKLLQQKRIAITGSGQSAAEIFYDLLQSSYTGEISWFTRSDGFLPMDYSKFALEKTSPDYINHFYSLPDNMKPFVLARQNNLYKGINTTLLTDIYSMLDDGTDASVKLFPACELTGVEPWPSLTFLHKGCQQYFRQQTDALILATGYKTRIPHFIDAIRNLIEWDKQGRYKVNRNYSIDKNNSIFVQNAESHTHGHNAADLGMGPYRNATILNTIAGTDHYQLESSIAFQQFGIPER